MTTTTGTSGRDVLVGTPASDTIDALGGIDVIFGNGGDDVINGGDETIQTGAFSNYGDGIDGGDGNDTLNGGAGDDTLMGGLGSDHLNGGADNDTLIGAGSRFGYSLFSASTPGGATFSAFNYFYDLSADHEVDYLNGGAGSDTAVVSFGDVADGGADDDRLWLSLNDQTTGITADFSVNATIQSTFATLAAGTFVNFETFYLTATAGADHIVVGALQFVDGAGGDDFIQLPDVYPAGLPVQALGGTGSDTIMGGTGDDEMYHADNYRRGLLRDDLDDGAADTLNGGAGNDTIHIGRGDTADGGVGTTDRLFLSLAGSTSGTNVDLRTDAVGSILSASGAHVSNFERYNLIGSGFADVWFGDAQTNNFYGYDGDDMLDVGGGNDLAAGGMGRDVISGGDGNDQLYGGAGSDTLYGGIGNDTIRGDLDASVGTPTGGGPDTAVFTGMRSQYVVTAQSDGSYRVVGPDGTDTLIGIERAQFLDQTITLGSITLGIVADDTGNAGFLNGTAGDDDLRGLAGDDFLQGAAGADMLDGGSGADIVMGQAGADVLVGGDGDDLLYGGTENDFLFGGAGNDFLRGDAGVDTFDGGDGVDRVSFLNFSATQGVIADLRTGVIANDGFGNAETMTGIEELGATSAFVDILDGDNGANGLLVVGSGDIIRAYGGDDRIQGDGSWPTWTADRGSTP